MKDDPNKFETPDQTLTPDYSKYYSPDSLSVKLRQFAQKAGSKVIYNVLLLYNLLNDKATPLKARLSIAAALGYFIFPADLIPDLMPMLGFTDDLGVLLFTLKQVSAYITPEIKLKSREQCDRLFRLKQVPESGNQDAGAGI